MCVADDHAAVGLLTNDTQALRGRKTISSGFRLPLPVKPAVDVECEHDADDEAMRQ